MSILHVVDYHDALREGRTTSNTAPTTAATPTPSPISPPPRPAQAPVHRQPPPDMANRPLPATPGPELPARPSRMKRESSGSSLPPSSAGGSRGMTNGATSASGGLSLEDIDFRNKLNHMGKCKFPSDTSTIQLYDAIYKSLTSFTWYPSIYFCRSKTILELHLFLKCSRIILSPTCIVAHRRTTFVKCYQT